MWTTTMKNFFSLITKWKLKSEGLIILGTLSQVFFLLIFLFCVNFAIFSHVKPWFMIPLVPLSSFVQRNKSPDSSLPSGSIMWLRMIQWVQHHLGESFSMFTVITVWMLNGEWHDNCSRGKGFREHKFDSLISCLFLK